MRKIVTYVVLVLVLGALVFVGMRLRQRRADEIAAVAPPEARAWAVRTMSVRKDTVREQFPCLATLASAAEITVSGQLPGTILELGPREGVAVKRGELLARIDTREVDEQLLALEAKIEAGRSAAEHADKELEREKDLLRVGGSTGSQVEQMRTAAVAAQKAVQALERQKRALAVRRGFATITSPVDGVVAARLAEPGDVCTQFHPLYRLTVARGAQLTVQLPQVVMQRIHVGMTVEFGRGEHARSVEISRVFPVLDARALGTAEADLETIPFGLSSGARVSARVVLDERRDALVVPPQALLRTGGGPHAVVFRIRDDHGIARVERVPVRVELASPGAVAVVGDLAAGERIVVAHAHVLQRLSDGDAVVTDAGRS